MLSGDGRHIHSMFMTCHQLACVHCTDADRLIGVRLLRSQMIFNCLTASIYTCMYNVLPVVWKGDVFGTQMQCSIYWSCWRLTDRTFKQVYRLASLTRLELWTSVDGDIT